MRAPPSRTRTQAYCPLARVDPVRAILLATLPILQSSDLHPTPPGDCLGCIILLESEGTPRGPSFSLRSFSDEAIFRFFSIVGAELDKASTLYMAQERKLCNFYLTLAAKYEVASRSVQRKVI